MLSNLQKHQNKIEIWLNILLLLQIYFLSCYAKNSVAAMHTCITTIRYTYPVIQINNSYTIWVGALMKQSTLSSFSAVFNHKHFLLILQVFNHKLPHHSSETLLYFANSTVRQKTSNTSNSNCSFATTHNLLINNYHSKVKVAWKHRWVY